jgi:hypothetical protein
MSESEYLQAAAESSSDTPEAADGENDGLVPSLSTRQKALVVGGVVVGIVVLLWLRGRDSEDESGPDPDVEIPLQVTDEDESDTTDGEAVTGTIEVPPNPSDPMAADEAVMDALRERGRITTMTEEG